MSPDKENPSISVVLTVKNDARALEETLAFLEAQTVLPDEILVVIAESHDDTLEVAKAWKGTQPQRIVLEHGEITRSRGRNIGARQAKGEILVFTDAGCFPEKSWLENLVRPFRERAVELVSGYSQGTQDSAFQEAQSAFVLVPLHKIGSNPLPATRNMALRSTVFWEYAGFREDLNFAEDYEFALRLQKSGIRSHFASDAVVTWRGRDSLWSFFWMILKLTAGDMSAGTWRRGHLSMWARYMFLALFFLLVSYFFSLKYAIGLSGIVYVLYLVTKCSQFRFSRKESYFWAILFQVCADIGVLTGTLYGIWQRKNL